MSDFQDIHSTFSQNGDRNGSKRGVVHSIGDVVSDVASLAELQFELFQVDLGESQKNVAMSAMVLCIGLLLLAGVFPVALLAIGAVLYEFAGISFSGALGIAGAIGLIGSGIICWIAISMLKRAFASFERSKAELKRNIGWLKEMKNRDHRSASTGAGSGVRYPR